jgi:hypothetical protein
MPPPEKYHMIFSLFLDPRFVSLKDLLDLHSHEYRYNLDYKIAFSKPYIQQMKDKLLDYIAAAENATNPIPESICGESMHLHEIKDLYGDATASDSQSTQLDNIKSLCSCQDVKEDVDVLAWYESVKYKVPKIHRMATFIFQFHLRKFKMNASFL